MSSKPPENWREWVRREQETDWMSKAVRRRRRRTQRAGYFKTALIVGCLLFLLIQVSGTGGLLRNQVDAFDSWAFWLGEPPVPVTAEPNEEVPTGNLTLAVINRSAAPGVSLISDGEKLESFDDWKIELTVKTGQTLVLKLDNDAQPVRVRVVANRGVRTPRLGQEWPVVSGRELMGAVTLVSD